MITDQPESSRTASDNGPKSREAMRAALERELNSPQTQCTPPSIPDHELLYRVGSGAYGDVWLARNALGTLRAVKIVYRARFEEDRPYEREFKGILRYEPISRTHEGLVQVLHVGRNDDAGCFYYVMEAADAAPGSSQKDLIQTYRPRTVRSELIQRQRLSPAEAADLALRLAGALSHLHTHGLVHRDVKPGNVIFVGRQPKLADIGLIAGAGDSKSFVGTEGFIPPEGPGTSQGDVYGLGKLLYELAMGRDRMDFPQLPSGVTQLPDREALLDLNEVITRACAPEPAHRYATAREMETELKLFLAGRSLREARKVERHLLWLKRFAFAASAFLMVAALAVWFAKNEARRAKQREQQSQQEARAEAALRARAEAAEHDSQQQLYTALLEQARATVRSGELGQRVRALDAIRRAAAISNSAELRREVLGALSLPDLRFERETPSAGATFIQLDPTFERIAIGRGTRPIEVHSFPDQRLIATLRPSTNLVAYGASWSPDGRFFAVKRDYAASGERADLEVWDVPSVRRILLLQNLHWGAMSFHPRLPHFLAGSRRGVISVWELGEGKEISRVTVPAPSEHVQYSPDGQKFAAFYRLQGSNIVAVYRLSDGVRLTSQSFQDRVGMFGWDPGGRWIAVGELRRGSVSLMDSFTGETRILGQHKLDAVTTVFSPDGRYLFSGGWERELICWDVQAMRRAFSIGIDSFNVQFRTDGRECAVFARAGVQFHSFERPTAVREFAEDLGSRLRQAVLSPDRRWLAASADDWLGVWDLEKGGPGALTQDGRDSRLFFSATGSELFASADNNCFRWHVSAAADSNAPPQLQRTHIEKPQGFTSLCLVSNLVVFTGSEGTRLVDIDEPARIDTGWVRTSAGLNSASPDGRWLAIYRPYSASVYIYTLPGLQRVAKLTAAGRIGSVKFSPAGDEVAVSSATDVTELWGTSDWQRTGTISNSMRLSYTADARAWWLMRDLRTAGLYDARTVEPLLPLPPGTVPLAISADGLYVAVSVDARRLQLWDIEEVRKQLRELGTDWAVAQ